MDTYFAPAEKADEKDLALEIELVSNNPILDGLLHSISGLLAILNEHRQLVSLNDSFMQMLGIDDPEKTLGLRLGEAVNCVHSHEEPGGCGTSKYCSTCGAAIAIVSAINDNKPKERICALSLSKGNTDNDLALLVRSQPIKIENKRFILLFLQDVTREQQRAALERTFYHDINNLLHGLVGDSELLALQDSKSVLAQDLHKLSLRLHKEIAIQKCLSEQHPCTYNPLYYETTISEIIKDLKSSFTNSPAALDKKIEISDDFDKLSLETDLSLLLRILCNMVTNALEATEKGETIKIWIEQQNKTITFCVWNKQVIPQDIALRIFQRNFSTKSEDGRGIGTFSMKLFGEKILGGNVDFTSSSEKGTIFTFSLPI